MIINNKLLKEIEEYCLYNNITDIETEVNNILRIGFNVIRFGTSPFNKIQQDIIEEEKIVDTPKKRGRKKKEKVEEVLEIKISDNVEISSIDEKKEENSQKKKVRIIKSK